MKTGFGKCAWENAILGKLKGLVSAFKFRGV